MTRTELTQALAQRAGLSYEAARRAVEGLFGNNRELGVIAAAMRAGERVQLPGFGIFAGRLRSARQGHDPRTRRPLLIPATQVPGFRASASLRTALRSAAASEGEAS